MSRPDVPRYYRISTRFWDDERSAKWPDPMKLAAVYFMTCKHRHLEGIYVLPLKYAAEDLGWTEKRVQNAVKFLESEDFLRYDSKTKVVLIRNSLKYQTPESENVVKGAIRRIKDLPKSPLLQEFQKLAREHCYLKGAPVQAQAFSVEVDQMVERLFQRPLEQPLERSSEHLNPNLQSETKTKIRNSTDSAESHQNGGGREKSFFPSFKNAGDEKDLEEPIEGNTRQGGITHLSKIMDGVMKHMTKGTWDHDKKF
ncbi:MAG: hypothetical protein R3B95_19850 [Nitrospirales bacterium]|nr:hypothetical protein [Nitrospirales bacterium]